MNLEKRNDTKKKIQNFDTGKTIDYHKQKTNLEKKWDTRKELDRKKITSC